MSVRGHLKHIPHKKTQTKQPKPTKSEWHLPVSLIFPLVPFISVTDLPLLSAPAEPPSFHGPSPMQMVHQTFSTIPTPIPAPAATLWAHNVLTFPHKKLSLPRLDPLFHCTNFIQLQTFRMKAYKRSLKKSPKPRKI